VGTSPGSGRRCAGFPVLTGSELLADLAVQLGAAGVVPGLGNVDPDGYVRLWRAGSRGDRAGAVAEQDRLVRLYTITEIPDLRRIGPTAAALGAFKAAMALRGTIADGRVNPPLLPLADTEVKAVAAVLDELGLSGGR
jgi:4-hydroxy-tetrahydrodipicolinate synthase